MAEPTRISPKQAYPRVQSGDAWLICAYDDEQKCAELHLEGAISLASFQSQRDAVPKDAELIFY